jgi:hypothetical protein
MYLLTFATPKGFQIALNTCQVADGAKYVGYSLPSLYIHAGRDSAFSQHHRYGLLVHFFMSGNVLLPKAYWYGILVDP